MRSSALWGMSHHGKRIVTKGKGEGGAQESFLGVIFLYTRAPPGVGGLKRASSVTSKRKGGGKNGKL